MERFMYWPPYGVTQPWKPRMIRGGDEWHNKSTGIILPFIGGFIFFWERDFSREGEEHLHSCTREKWGYVEYFGRIVPDCEICTEIKAAFDE